MIYPNARYRPLNEFSYRGVKPRLGVVLHVNDSDGPSLYNWIAGNNGMSCHFQIAKSGVIEQYVDTDNASWCQCDGNATYLSVETQGYDEQPLNAAQLGAFAALMRWIHNSHGIPLQLAEAPGQRGLGWHGMGGPAWGHTVCPGQLRRNQRTTVLRLAGMDTPPPGPRLRRLWPSYMPRSEYFGSINGPAESHGGYYSRERPDVRAIQARLQQLHYAPSVPGWADGIYEQPTVKAVADWQRARYARYTTRYGEVWSDDWQRLFTY